MANPDAFARIKSAAKVLNARADGVTAEIREIENRLDDAGAGFDVEDNEAFHDEDRSEPDTDASVPTDEDPPDRRVVDRWILQYARVGNRFRVAYKIETRTLDGEGYLDQFVRSEGPFPLADSDRQTRIRAAERLSDLVEQIATKLEETATKLK